MVLFNTPQLHIYLCFEEIKLACQPANHSSWCQQGGGNDNCLNMPQLALIQCILIHPRLHSITSLCSGAQVKSKCPSVAPADAQLSNFKSPLPCTPVHSPAIVPTLSTHYASQKQSQSKNSSSSPLDEPKSIYLGFIHQQLSSA